MKSRLPQARAFQNGVAMRTAPKLGSVDFKRSFGGTIATIWDASHAHSDMRMIVMPECAGRAYSEV